MKEVNGKRRQPTSIQQIKHFSKKAKTTNPAADEKPNLSSSSTQLSNIPSAIENQAFDFDVFLSFRGEDTRRGFTSHLHEKLVERGLSAFIDEEDLKKGERITNLIQCIEKSNIFIPILSRRYANSRWCLMEIAKIVECKRLIIPVFYDVDPSYVRSQSASFGRAFAKHQKKYDGEKVEEWRKAVREVGEISGYHLSAIGNEAHLINVILKDVERALSKIPMEVARHPIGIESRVYHMMNLLDLGSDEVRMVGIHGEGGLGKTTISKAVYNELYKNFEGSSFLLDIRERSNQPNGLVDLQSQLLKNILKKKHVSIDDVEHGIATIKQKLRSKRILLVLDDVDSKEQLNKLAGDSSWFGAGSRIIVSTRNEGLLNKHWANVKYKPEVLDGNQSLQLFSRHAFESDRPLPEYTKLSKSVVEYAGGMPLALEVFGPIFFTIRNKKEWMEMLDRLKAIQDRDLSKRLRISYEALDLEEKSVFLDFACFFIGSDTEYPQHMWKRMGFHPSITIKALQQKSLIKIEYDEYKDGRFMMHDQIKDMGRNIVKEEAFEDPGMRSRLWSYNEILPVLDETRDNIQGIIMKRDESHEEATDCEDEEKRRLSTKAFAGMRNLRFLCVHNVMFEGSVLQLPKRLKWLQMMKCTAVRRTPAVPDLIFDAHLEELVVLEMSDGDFCQILWNHQAMEADGNTTHRKNKMPNLKVLTLQMSWSLVETPDFSGCPKLEKLILDDCYNLDKVDDSIGQLKNLTHLSMPHCFELNHLPDNICKLKNLEILNLFCCEGICELPERLGDLESLKQLDLRETNVRKLPTSLTQLKRLTLLLLNDTKLEELPRDIGRLESLQKLFLDRTPLKRIPTSIGKLVNLRRLYLSGCSQLKKLPDSISRLSSLRELDLNGTNIAIITKTSNIDGLSSLKKLLLNDCKNLSSLPPLPSSLTALSARNCTALKTMPDISNLKKIKKMDLTYCKKLNHIPGLDTLQSFRKFSLFL